MATATPAVTIDDTPDVQVFDVTSAMFFQMIEAGVFPPERRVFLWGGRLYEKMAKTTPHATTSTRIHRTLGRRLPDDWLIWAENPITLDSRHAPLPDVVVVRGPLERYEDENRPPEAADVGLIVEIAVSSLRHDLTVRAEKFARAQVPNYWVADVLGRRIVEHTGPQIIDGVGSYVHVESRQREEGIRLVLDGREVAVIPVAELIR